MFVQQNSSAGSFVVRAQAALLHSFAAPNHKDAALYPCSDPEGPLGAPERPEEQHLIRSEVAAAFRWVWITAASQNRNRKYYKTRTLRVQSDL